MVVWKVHSPEPSVELKSLMIERLGVVADEIFGSDGWKVDDHMRNIPDHYHAHARPPYFWRR
jgi:hypothetical protein